MADFKNLLSMIGNTVEQGPADDAYVRKARAGDTKGAEADYKAALKRDELRFRAERDDRDKRTLLRPDKGRNELAPDTTSTKGYETDEYAQKRFEDKHWDKAYDRIKNLGLDNEKYVEQPGGHVRTNFQQAMEDATNKATNIRNATGQTQAERDALEQFLLKQAGRK